MYSIDLNHSAEIVRDLRERGFRPGLFVLNIGARKSHAGIRYEFFPYASEEQAFEGLALQYKISGRDAGCRALLPPGEDGLEHGSIQRWLVTVTPQGALLEHALLVAEYLEGEHRRVDVLDVRIQKLLNQAPAPRMR